MKDRIRHHLDIIFAAAPQTAKSQELKEELLASLNDRYDDLLQSGYDSTAAFHIAISGIGDVDELFQACRDETNADKTPQTQKPVPETDEKKTPHISLFVAIVVAMTITLQVFIFNEVNRHIGIPIAAICWVCAFGVIIYHENKHNSRQSTQARETTPQNIPEYHAEEIRTKRITAGILAIVFGVFGVHKFYLGFPGNGSLFLFITLASFFMLAPLAAIIGLIEGLLYLLKSDRDFYQDYIVEKRSWF